MSRARRLIVASLISLASAGHAIDLAASSLYDPLLRFRMLPTEHFIIYYHQGEEALARRLASIAEETWLALRKPLGIAPPRRTHVVFVDQTDLANGWATPLPYDTIMVTAAWPLGSEFTGDTDDWLRLVFTHEFTHIVHLDRSVGWARVVRRLFGRMEIAFPNLFLPGWQIEGLATYEESVVTGEGRLHAGDFRAIVDEAARQRALEPLDRVNGGLTDWPDGHAQYAYGSGFHQYLADRFGADTLAALADATAGRFPYTSSRVFKRVYGQSLGKLWSDYEASLPRETDTAVGDVGIKRITHHGFEVSGPRFDRFTCPTCPAGIVYSVRNPHGFPAMNHVTLDGAGPRRLTRRFLGSTTAIGREAIYFDQQEYRRNAALYSDLYVLSRESGGVRQLTSEARLLDPDLSPDGGTLVCVQDRPGQRNLVVVPLASGVSRTNPAIETLIAEPETQFNAPRWSPDGRSIAVERHRRGSLSEIVLVDLATKSVRVLASTPGARVVTPAWRPDGHAIVAAVGPQDQTFNLFEFSLDEGVDARQLTHTTGGATWPDVSPDGKTVVFVGYTLDGFDLFTMPYLENASGPGAQAESRAEQARPTRSSEIDPGSEPARPLEMKKYSPLGTLRPTSWTPVIEVDSTQFRLGAATGGFDVLGYHGYVATATWLVSSPSGAPAPSAASPDWNLYYAYARWRPTFWVGASMSTSFFSGPPTDLGTPTSATLREREFQGGVILPIRHARVSHLAAVTLLTAQDDYTLATGNLTRDRTALRGAWETTSARTYGYSISPEDGVTVGVTAERVPPLGGASADATVFTTDARAYLPGIARHHVVAVRVAGGTSMGDATLGRTFHLGGAGPDRDVISFDRNAISLLRGFSSDTFAGSHVALLNVDYRWPIARPQRGVGTWPAFVHTFHAAAFADVGHTWTRMFRTDAVKTSVGGELSANVVAGYVFPFIFTAGAAWGHDGSGIVRDGATAFVRLGYAFSSLVVGRWSGPTANDQRPNDQ